VLEVLAYALKWAVCFLPRISTDFTKKLLVVFLSKEFRQVEIGEISRNPYCFDFREIS
jgi:hypothetical protein